MHNPTVSIVYTTAFDTPVVGHWLGLSRTEELAKAGSFAHDRRALQQLALNVQVKHSDLT